MIYNDVQRELSECYKYHICRILHINHISVLTDKFVNNYIGDNILNDNERKELAKYVDKFAMAITLLDFYILYENNNKSDDTIQYLQKIEQIIFKLLSTVGTKKLYSNSQNSQFIQIQHKPDLCDLEPLQHVRCSAFSRQINQVNKNSGLRHILGNAQNIKNQIAKGQFQEYGEKQYEACKGMFGF